ncbi:MAG: hypothetical protein H6865_07915 [Rhodospirillales bacterium]|nr:hypothetical protein [Alphaproteobacteria bacterium]MCB9987541.1 hypothetical protein [Rhodospirillales bacterium]USO07737.1 MAG: hypothetical protein H6866_00435 [Rhodospirillales bacterium]
MRLKLNPSAAAFLSVAALSLAGCAGNPDYVDPQQIAATVTNQAISGDKLGESQSGKVETVTRQTCRNEQPGAVASLFGEKAKRVCGDTETTVYSSIITGARKPSVMARIGGLSADYSVAPLQLGAPR